MNENELLKLTKINLLVGKSDKDFRKIVNYFKTYDSVYNVLTKELNKVMEKDLTGVLRKYLLYFCDTNIDIKDICDNLNLFLDNLGFTLEVKDAIKLINYEPKIDKLLEEYVSENIEVIELEDLFLGNNVLSTLIMAYIDINNIELKGKSKNKDILPENDKLLTKEEEKELLIKAKSGDIKARDTLVVSNIGLARMVANWYRNRGMEFEDLVSEGCIGLIKAIEDFDINRDVRFSTYAVPKIRAVIGRTIDNKARLIRRPVGRADIIDKVNIASEKLATIVGHIPSIEEISDYLGISKEIVEEALNDGTNILSLETPMKTESKQERTIEDTIEQTTYKGPEEHYISVEMKEKVATLLETSNLTDREKEIIKLKYGFDGEERTYRQVAKMENISQTFVQKKEHSAIKKMRENPKIIDYAEYLGNKNRALKSLRLVKKMD